MHNRALLFVILAIHSDSRAQEQFAITDIGSLDPTADFTVPTNMNNRGVVIGASYVYNGGDPISAFVWSHGIMQAVTEPAGARIAHARAINDVGQIAGDATTFDGITTPYRWAGDAHEVIGYCEQGERRGREG
ncbi:MAG: hypothetical protein JNG88_13045 [Phycisphaerales bacterium]|nr:hypothetical protein [Phycisphaerales bacterium]